MKFYDQLTTPSSPDTQPQKTADPVLPEGMDGAPGPDSALRQNAGKRPHPSRHKRTVKTKSKDPSWDVSRFDVPIAEGRVRFHDLDLPAEIMHAIADQGFTYCTPIQAEILPQALAGSDTTGRAQTGTGKTAAFLIDIYTRLLSNPIQGRRRHGVPRVLILAPTRELVLQIEKDARDIGKYTDIRIEPVFGGLDYEKQKRALAEKVVDIMIATPGRLLDFQRQKRVHLNEVEILVIDEADRMLDMGFIPDVRKIVHSTPPKDRRQTMFFSATLTPEVERLSEQWTRDPVHVEIEPEQVAADSVNQMVYIVTAKEKFTLLINLVVGQDLQRVLVFTNRKDQTVRLADRLKQYRIRCAILSGDVPQKKRIQTLDDFRNGRIRVLVATDVAARGLHIEGISHVINFTLPQSPEDYVHRIGRTGRAGATGISVSFACEDDSFFIPAIEEYLGHPLSCVYPDSSLLEKMPPLVQVSSAKKSTVFPSRGRRVTSRAGTPNRRKSHSG
ncbi:MAG: DEAD/DEAH box helicase [Deltaproteobacteria bacterium]|nr:DEAD/DEAH box helicase [Deltaproteobacteria bacterium]